MGWRPEYLWDVVSSTRRNVFIILCNDSWDNNSFSSEGISSKMEESIKMLYARIYKLGNFPDYCNHLQNWLFQCGIDRSQQPSLTASTRSHIYSYWSLNQVTISPFAFPQPQLVSRSGRLSKNFKSPEVAFMFLGWRCRCWWTKGCSHGCFFLYFSPNVAVGKSSWSFGT